MRYPLPSHHLSLIGIVGWSLAFGLVGCGGGSSGGSSSSAPPTTTTQPQPASLSLGSITAQVDSSVPSPAVSLVREIVTNSDAQPVGSKLTIAGDSSGAASPIMAVNTDQEILLAGMSISTTIQLSAKTTAETLVLITFGDTGTSSIDQLISAIDSSSGFAKLTNDIQASLSQGTSPVNSSDVMKDIVGVQQDLITQSYQKVSARESPTVNPRAAQSSVYVVPPVPVQIVGFSSTFKRQLNRFMSPAHQQLGVSTLGIRCRFLFG